MRELSNITVTLNKAELLGRIKTNRDRHRKVFEEAVEGYRKAVIEQLEDRLAAIRQGKGIDLIIRLPEPEDHTADYDRVLDMLAMHQGETIELGQEDFAMYVRDEWRWKRAWVDTLSNYTRLAE